MIAAGTNQYVRRKQITNAEYSADQIIIVMENIAISVMTLKKVRHYAKDVMERDIVTNAFLETN